MEPCLIPVVLLYPAFTFIQESKRKEDLVVVEVVVVIVLAVINRCRCAMDVCLSRIFRSIMNPSNEFRLLHLCPMPSRHKVDISQNPSCLACSMHSPIPAVQK